MKKYKPLTETVSHYFEIVRNPNYPLKNEIIQSSGDARKCLMMLYHPVNLVMHETFICLFLNRKNGIIGHVVLSVGGITATIVDSRILFLNAIQLGATGIILSHNHPSGNATPSEADNSITKKIKEGAKLLDLLVLDHIIITEDAYYSYADEGTL